MLTEAGLRHALDRLWGLPGAEVRPHHGGMNSATWLVDHDGRRWVAKAVPPAAERQLRGGLAVAARVEEAGIPAGAPRPTLAGRPVADVGGQSVALLTWVAGTPLTGAEAPEQRLIGATLARVHGALTGAGVDDAYPFHWVDPTADHLAVRSWIRAEVAAAVAALEALRPDRLSHGLLHTDPAPEAFHWDADRGVCGLIDWSVGMSGPLLYDVASAVMYLGGPGRATAFLAAYLDSAVLSPAEVERGLLVMLRFRLAVQADYFARRIMVGDLTGIRGPDENEKGLAHARDGLRRSAGR